MLAEPLMVLFNAAAAAACYFARAAAIYFSLRFLGFLAGVTCGVGTWATIYIYEAFTSAYC